MAFEFDLELNPITGTFDLVVFETEVEIAEKRAREYDCNVAAAINDLVIFSTVTADKVEELTSNSYGSSLVAGIIIEKPTTTRAKVLFAGPVTGFSGLTQGNLIVVGTDGKVTTTVPTTGDLQILGIASSTTEIDFAPERNKVTL